ncbi:hypothetical protein GCM10025331_38300 [Actinoplanes utahensis]|nr:hypothetical protein Aut01nite_45370 [Actinoplanes utahensis]
MLSTAVVLLISPEHRRRSAVTVAGSTVAIFFVGVAALVDGRGEDFVDRTYSADGRYEARVLPWTSVLGEEGWDVAIYRRDGLRFIAADAGCLFSEVAAYRRIRSVEAGHVSIATDHDVVDVRFDPDDMRIITPIPADLCAGYG